MTSHESIEPWDSGRPLIWHPLGTFQARGPVNATPLLLHLIDLSQYAVARVDFASIDVVLALGDHVATGALTLRLASSGTAYPFLSFSNVIEYALTGEAQVPSEWNPIWQNNQLALPFYVTGSTYVECSGYGLDGSGSVITGTVGISVAYAY